MICKHCKTINSDDAKFCRCCGNKLRYRCFPSLVTSVIFLFVCLITGLIIVLMLKPHNNLDSDIVVNNSIDRDVAAVDIAEDSLAVDEDGEYTVEDVSFLLQSDSSFLAHIKINSSEELIKKKKLCVVMRFWQSNYQSCILDKDEMQLSVEKDIFLGHSPTYETLCISKKMIDIIKDKCYGRLYLT